MLALLAVLTVSLATTAIRSSATTLRSDAVLLVEGYVMAFVAYKAGRRIVIDEARLRRVTWGLAAVGAYLAFTGLAQYTVGWDFVPDRIEIVHPMRIVGPFGNGVYYAIATSLAFLVALVLWGMTTRRELRWAVVLAAAAMLVVIALAKGRAPWLGLILALVFAVWRRRDLLRPLAAATLVAGAVVPALTVRPQETYAPPERLSEQSVHEDASFVARAADTGPMESRIAMLVVSANMAVHHPIVGLGFGSEVFDSNKDRFFPDHLGIPREWADWPTVPHNEFLFVLVLTGLVGLIPLVGLHITIWRRLAAMEAGRHPGHAEAGAARAAMAPVLRGCQIVVLLNAMFVDLIFFSYVLILFFFLVGVAEARDVPRSIQARAILK
jgi:O-antigen ligase